MTTRARLAVLAALAVAVALTVAARERAREVRGEPAASSVPARPAGPPAALPRFLEIGSTRCQACKEMEKVLASLRESHAGRLRVDFVDVAVDPEGGERHGIRLIPTQILYDSAGRELFRHEGFYSAEQILGKFRELGVPL